MDGPTPARQSQQGVARGGNRKTALHHKTENTLRSADDNMQHTVCATVTTPPIEDLKALTVCPPGV